MAEPVSVILDNIPETSEHLVGTEQAPMASRGQVHREGGWPKEIDPSEAQDTAKWRKRLDKDPQFGSVLKQLVSEVQSAVDMNNTMSMFEDFFSGESPEHEMHTLSASTVAFYKDQVPDEYRRGVSKISFSPEGERRFLASYSSTHSPDDDAPKSSFVWSVASPNAPLGELVTGSPLTCAHFYPKNADVIAGGTQKGLVQAYDLRTGWKPTAKSGFEKSHYSSVSEFVWLQSKTHSECVSVGGDGRVLWWDIRKLQEPTEICVLSLTEGGRPFGGVSLEWQQEAGPTKYLVGTEEGVIVALNKKPKKPTELGGWHGFEERGGHGRHAGPVLSVKRNPLHPKFFLSVGDWSAKLWIDELKGPLTVTPPAPSLITCGGWSPVRAGVFYTAREDGVVDFFDYYYRMNEVAYSHKVTDSKITAVNMQGGEFMAVGDASGSVTLLRLCEELAIPSAGEKVGVGAIFERETRREKNLEAIKKQMVQAKGTLVTSLSGEDFGDENVYLERESGWLNQMGIFVKTNSLGK